MLDHNYELGCVMYNKYIKDMFKQIPTTMTKALTPEQKSRKL